MSTGGFVLKKTKTIQFASEAFKALPLITSEQKARVCKLCTALQQVRRSERMLRFWEGQF